MMDDTIRRWFIEKVAQNPDYLDRVYIPALERLLQKAEYALDQAIRNEGIEKIKYQMGWRDGVREACTLLNGLRLAEEKQSRVPGLMERMFHLGAS